MADKREDYPLNFKDGGKELYERDLSLLGRAFSFTKGGERFYVPVSGVIYSIQAETEG